MKIRVQLGLSTSLLVIMVSAGIGGGLFVSQKSLILRSIEKDQDRMVTALAAVGKQYLLNKNDLLIANYLAVVKKMDGVVYAYVLRARDERILSHTDSRYLYKPLSAWVGEADRLPKNRARTEAIFLGDRKEAEAVIGFSDQYTREAVQAGVRTLMVRIGTTMLASMTLGLAAALSLAAFFTGPIEQLVRGAEAIGKGNFAVKVAVGSGNELGQLSLRFNEMAGQLAQLDQMKDDFIATVSHDLRSPLASIIMSGENLMQNNQEPLTARQRLSLQMIVSSGNRLSVLINNILDAAKIKAGRMEYDLKPQDLPRLLSEVIETLKPLAQSKNLALILDGPAEFHQVLADGQKVQQVVTNLISNAIKFTPKDGRISVLARLEGGMAKVAIADTGRGIAPQDLGKLFRKFVQLNARQETEVSMHSTGLGLVIVKEMIEAQGGKVWAESQLGKGSTFIFTLPLA
jgi:signal transduction histidine kinase